MLRNFFPLGRSLVFSQAWLDLPPPFSLESPFGVTLSESVTEAGWAEPGGAGRTNILASIVLFPKSVTCHLLCSFDPSLYCYQ
ncbi:hypothetical protein TNIN_237241 [Trichonephila inaurata madagascariensis]|uniref:Uncharacterized protein n=1 Tax=Trichonephila inaurata madagascariensis TaxID=2747483 RepID=A0A8X6WZT6_9ARAC|nr:hypothetical protein TNIN_237241 [Trichonephila inaurata madagascariensis]